MSRVEALEERLAGARGELGLTTLRFLSHPAVGDVFPEYLICLYHSMHTAGAVMGAALDRSRELAVGCPVARRLVPYWESHIREESGHDRWLLTDLERLGVDVERAIAAPPRADVAELMGTLYFWALHAHPVAVIGYFLVIEGSPPPFGLLDWMVEAGIAPRKALETFYRHAMIDVEHGRELRELIDELPLSGPQDQLLVSSAQTVLGQLTRLFGGFILAADRSLPKAGEPASA